MALELVHSGYQNSMPRTDLAMIGTKGIRVFRSQIDHLLDSMAITEHDAVIALHVATILCGGDHLAGTATEQHFLNLERDAFLSLLGMQKTQERIEFFLKNNKPLRN
jgi:3-hydroxyacyl-CoA dehydrogenase